MSLSNEFENELWDAAEKLRGSVEPSEYRHIILGLLFLQDATQRYNDSRAEVEAKLDDVGAGNADDLKYYWETEEDKQEILNEENTYTADGAVFVPEEARWDEIVSNARSDNPGGYGNLSVMLDKSLKAIENTNDRLEDKLPEDRYRRAGIDSDRLASVIEKFDDISSRGEETDDDVMGRTSEYFIGRFAREDAEGDGAFLTPGNVVQLLVEILRPLDNMKVYDPCVGSGGMFVESQQYANDITPDANLSFKGQELNKSSVQLCEMNMFLHGLDAEIKHGDTLYDDQFPDLKADRVITNPPFNYDWERGKISKEDREERFPYGLPKDENANFAFMQHMLHHLAEGGLVGTVMANGALSSNQNNEGEIRKKIIQNDLLDTVITLPTKLFYTAKVPSSIWVFSKGKGVDDDGVRVRESETLFIDAEDMFEKASRSQNKLGNEHIETIASTIHKYRGEKDAGAYEDIPGFCKAATIDDIADNDYNVNPGRYVGIEERDEGQVPLSTKLPELYSELDAQFQRADDLQSEIRSGLEMVMDDD